MFSRPRISQVMPQMRRSVQMLKRAHAPMTRARGKDGNARQSSATGLNNSALAACPAR